MCECLLRYRGRNKREGQRYIQPAVNTALTSRGRLPAIIHTHTDRGRELEIMKGIVRRVKR